MERGFSLQDELLADNPILWILLVSIFIILIVVIWLTIKIVDSQESNSMSKLIKWFQKIGLIVKLYFLIEDCVKNFKSVSDELKSLLDKIKAKKISWQDAYKSFKALALYIMNSTSDPALKSKINKIFYYLNELRS